MDSSSASLIWLLAACFAVAAVAAVATILRPSRRLPQDFDFERHKRFENR